MITPRTDVSSAVATCAPATRQSPGAGVQLEDGGAAVSTTAGGGGTAFLCLATCFTRSGEGFVSRGGEAGGDGGVTFGAGSSDGDDEGSDGDDAGDAGGSSSSSDDQDGAGEGDRDLGQFLATAQKVGLLVVLRAGPYMCGEWCARSASRSSCSRR